LTNLCTADIAALRQEQSFADPKSNRRNRPFAEIRLRVLDHGTETTRTLGVRSILNLPACQKPSVGADSGETKVSHTFQPSERTVHRPDILRRVSSKRKFRGGGTNDEIATQ